VREVTKIVFINVMALVFVGLALMKIPPFWQGLKTILRHYIYARFVPFEAFLGVRDGFF
jgi:hypothetical protein